MVYDHATSLNNGLFKRFNLSLVTQSGYQWQRRHRNAGERTAIVRADAFAAEPVRQRCVYAAGNLNSIAELGTDPVCLYGGRPGPPGRYRFLHVLQGANAGVAMTPATYLQSSSGSSFDGAVFGSAAVYFPVIRNQPFAGITFAVPAGVHQMLVTGLTPGASYAVSVQAVGGGNTVSVDVGSGSSADVGGVLSLAF